MPNGTTHDTITKITTPIPAVGTYLLTNSIPLALLVGASHLFSGLWLSPDLDLPGTHPHKRWKSLGLDWIWLPYEKLIPHRGISHTPLIGTLSRAPFMIPLLCYGLLTENGALSTILVCVIIGLESGAISHYVPDLLITEKKKIIRKLKNNVFGVRKRRRR